MGCPSDVELLDMASGRLAADRRAELEVHLDRCPACLTAFAAAVRTASRAPDLEGQDPPPTGAARYVLAEEIGRGGMGRIVAAHDRLLDRRVALKLVRATGESLARRFAREQRITARLQHPAIVPIYDAGVLETGEPFFAMRMVSGQRLDEAAAGAATLEDRLRLLPAVIAVVDAVAYAHGEGVLHRDLKPQNVLVGPFGEVVLVDWGLARARDVAEPDEVSSDEAPAPEVTRAGAVLGTLGYMAPEQLAGDPVDERADIYGLGALLYHVLTGEPPHRDRGVGSTAHAPTRLAEALTEAPADLIATVERAMSPAREARYATARELSEDLKRWQAGRMVSAHRYSVRELIGRFVRRHRTTLAVAGAALVILVVGGVLGLRSILAERTRAEEASHVAEAQRDRAEVQRRGAESLIDFMLGDLRERLDRLGRLDALQGVAHAVLAYHDTTPEAGSEARVSVALLAGDVAIASGDLASAERAYERATTATNALPPGEATDALRCRAEIGTARSHRARGALDAAARAFTSCIERAGEPPRRLLREPSLDARSGLAAVARQRNDPATARRIVDAAVPLADAMAADPSVTSSAPLRLHFERWKTLDASGEVALALAEATVALRLAEARHANRPDDANLRHELATARLQLGISEEASGAFDRAEAAYRASLEEARAISAHDPANTTWLRDRGVAADRLGNLMLRKRDLPAALGWLRESDQQSRQLVALQPNDLDWQRDLGVSALALGDVLVELRRLDEARTEITRALGILEQIQKVAPGRARKDLGAALGHLADLEVQAGREPAARVAFARSAQLLREALAAADTPDARHELAVALALQVAFSPDDQARLALLREARELLAPLRGKPGDPKLVETLQLLDKEYAALGGK